MTHIGLNAHLLSSQKGYRTAGIHGYIHNLLAHLHRDAPEGWRFTAMVGAANAATFDGLTMQRAALDTESPLRRILWEQVMQPFALRRFDLYHALAFVAPMVAPPPLVVTVYDLSFVHYPGRLPATRRLYLRGLTTLTCKRARRVIGISHSTAQDVITTLGVPADRVDVAVPGYDHAAFKPLDAAEVAAFRTQKGLPERFWLFVGTLEPRKNLPTLLKAYAALPADERLPLVVGGGKGWQYDDIFATISNYELEDAVAFPGFIPADKLPLWYNSAEAFVYPSVFEGFGLPVLEAMACGTPVIVSDVSSLPEVVGDAGLRVPPHDVEAWSAALRRAFADADWRKDASQRGLQETKRYDWRDTARSTLRSYRLALNVDFR